MTQPEAGCTCPAQARAILDDLEAKLGEVAVSDPKRTGLFDDRNPVAPAPADTHD